MIDTHCHLDSRSFPEGADVVIERANQANVFGFICIGVSDLATAEFAKSLAERRSDVVATAGVHPHDASTYDDELEAGLLGFYESEHVVAVGETGLDYHYNHAPKELQHAVFRRQIGLARQVRKPLVIHTRSAPGDTLDILEEEGAREVGGVIHCFSEDRAFGERALALGFDLSFSGIVTFKTAHAIQDVARWAPLDRILLETDSPYLSPIPLRGKRCEPGYMQHTALFIAQLRGMSLEALDEATTKNAIRRFGSRLARALRQPHTN